MTTITLTPDTAFDTDVDDAGLGRDTLHAETKARPGVPLCGATGRKIEAHDCGAGMGQWRPIQFWLRHTRCPGCGRPLCGYCRLLIRNLIDELP